jgi:hypothetical protein
MTVYTTNSNRQQYDAERNGGMSVFHVWYFTENLFSKWVVVTALSQDDALMQAQKLPDYHRLDSIIHDN